MSTTFTRAAARLLVVPVATSAFLASPAPVSHAEIRTVAVATSGRPGRERDS